MKTHDDEFHPAMILDRDNQILSSGEARIYTAQSRGVFLPHTPPDEEKLLTHGAIVLVSRDRIPLRHLERCRSYGNLHYEFDFDS